MEQNIKITAEPVDATRCKFTVDRPVYPGGAAFFGDRQHASGSPLAEKLFAIPGINDVLISENNVTVSKNTPDADWLPVAKQVGAAIRAQLQSGVPAVSEKLRESLPPAQELRRRVQEILDHNINPAVASHGGFIELLDVRANNVYIRMGGGCQGCGMANVTLKQGIERSIREAVPEVGEILDTTDHASGRNPYYAPSK